MNPFHSGKLASVACAVALLFVAAGAKAQAIYKQTDDAGHVTFSDQAPAKPLARATRRGTVDANEATRRLKQARLERTLGAAPASGELTRGSGSRTANYRYWQRQEKLRLVVEQAQRRSTETQRLLVAAR